MKDYDKLTAVHVMGWQSLGDRWATGPKHADRVVNKKAWKPSTDMYYAWEIVKKLQEKHNVVHMTVAPAQNYKCEIKTKNAVIKNINKSMCVAVCKASLAVK